MRPSIRSELLLKMRTSFSRKIDLPSRRIGDGRTVSAGRHTPMKAESFIRGATLRTRGRAGRSAEDRLLCKQEALGSNPSRSTLLEVQPNSARPAFSSDLGQLSGICSD